MAPLSTHMLIYLLLALMRSPQNCRAAASSSQVLMRHPKRAHPNLCRESSRPRSVATIAGSTCRSRRKLLAVWPTNKVRGMPLCRHRNRTRDRGSNAIDVPRLLRRPSRRCGPIPDTENLVPALNRRPETSEAIASSSSEIPPQTRLSITPQDADRAMMSVICFFGRGLMTFGRRLSLS